MNHGALLDLLGGQPFFDLAMVVQLSGERRENLRIQIHRWVKQGKLLALRRGMYAWPERYRRVPLNPLAVANALHRPSYLSGLWALAQHGLIPEGVVAMTSVTSRLPRRFVNALGVFEYRHIRQDFFFGYAAVELGGSRILMAEPEKALLDYWHLTPGLWTMDRMREMRFQNREVVSMARLDAYALQSHSPRLREAVKVWARLADEDSEGTVEL